MLQYGHEREIPKIAEKLIPVQTLKLRAASAILSYYLTVNTFRSASALSVQVYGIAIEQFHLIGEHSVYACALCISPDRAKVENLLHFMIQHTVFPIHLKEVLENMDECFTAPPLILTEEEQLVLDTSEVPPTHMVIPL